MFQSPSYTKSKKTMKKKTCKNQKPKKNINCQRSASSADVEKQKTTQVAKT